MTETQTLPHVERHRFTPQRRKLTIIDRRNLGPGMLRLTLAGRALEGFTSLSPEDHIKLFVPDGAGGVVMRDYTPRRYDAAAHRLEIDFALHEAGPATLWAMAAQIGDEAEIGGPRGSQVIAGPIARWLLIGDETALPAIGRRIEEMAPGTPVTSLVALRTSEDAQSFTTAAEHRALWVLRADPTDPQPLLNALAQVEIDAETFVWIAAEAGVARCLRDTLRARGVAPAWMKAAGYWVAGAADSSVKEL